MTGMSSHPRSRSACPSRRPRPRHRGRARVLAISLAAAAGPPFPAPVTGQRVYDTAGVFTAGNVRDAETAIAAIEQRTGAQIVVYTQVKPESDTPDLAEADAAALGTQWGVGRKGFDDGLVILFDLDTSRCHGQVQLDAGAGFSAAFLSNSERQAIYQDDMLPYLRSCDMGQALTVALQKIDAAATPDHAANLERARQLDAVLGLVVAPLLLVLLILFAAWHWLRYGRDPVYLDDPSIHMPAPPPDLTPASAALVWDGRSSRHTLTTALIDLASHGIIAFREESEGMLIHHTKVGIETEPTVAETPALGLIRRNPLGPAEMQLQDAIGALPGADASGYVDPAHVPGLATHTDAFDSALEAHVVQQGWFKATKKVVSRWLGGGIAEAVLGIVGIVVGANLPSQGIVLVGIALLVAGIVTVAIGYAMPCRTMSGAMIRAVLAAYRRTLSKTMAQARSMQQVVDEAKLPWLQTPDQAFVWGVALGLQSSVQGVLDRSVDDASQTPAGAVSHVWFPIWYGSSIGGAAGGGNSGGLMSSSPIPNVMPAVFAAIGIGRRAPSSSGSGGGGGGSFRRRRRLQRWRRRRRQRRRDCQYRSRGDHAHLAETAKNPDLPLIRPLRCHTPVSAPANRLASAIRAANNIVHRESWKADSDYAGMGTTMVAALLREEVLTIAHVGGQPTLPRSRRDNPSPHHRPFLGSSNRSSKGS